MQYIISLFGDLVNAIVCYLGCVAAAFIAIESILQSKKRKD